MKINPLTGFIILPIIVLLVSCNSSTSDQSDAVSTETPDTAIEAESDTTASDPFGNAVSKAMEAANLTQTAQTSEEWSQVASLWEEAIALMRSVPEGNENYQTAQQKAQEYIPNLDYARNNAAFDASCNSDSLQFLLNSLGDESQPEFTLYTNLPDNTKVMFELTSQGYTAQQSVLVQDGKVSVGPFSNDGSPLEGLYTLEVTSFFNQFWQDEAVLPLLNEYESPCIREEEGSLEASMVLRLERTLEIGNLAAAEDRIQAEYDEALSIFNEAQSLLEIGEKNIAELRQNSSAPACFNDLQARMRQVDALRSRADDLSNDWFTLQVAVNNLSLCSTCDLSTAESYCSEARSFLEEAATLFE